MNKQAIEKIRGWRQNPKKFAWDNFKIELDEWQVEGLDKLTSTSYIPRRRIGFKACTGPGKTAILAVIGWWRLACFGEVGEHPKGAALSGEGRDNLRDNLWAELSKWQSRSEFLKDTFTWTKELIFANDHAETWFLAARSYPKDADTEAIGRSMSGLHSKYPFILLDETGEMPPQVGQKAEQIFTGGTKDGLIGMAGNPTSNDGLLYHACTALRDLWDIITITADPDDPRRTPRVDIEHARDMIKRYGKDNPWVMATILGLFPPSSLNRLLGPDEVDAAMKRHLREDQYSHSQKRLGVDVARFGDDRTILFPRQGLVAFKPSEMRNARSTEVAARVIMAKAKWQQELEFIDGTGGYGAGVIDSMIQGGHSPIEVHFSGKADDPRYFNKRSEMWFRMAEWVKRGGCLPNLPELSKELVAPSYTYQNGKLRLEEKDQIKERIGCSPDLADALCLTFAYTEMPAMLNIPGLASTAGKLLHEYDPFGSDRT